MRSAGCRAPAEQHQGRLETAGLGAASSAQSHYSDAIAAELEPSWTRYLGAAGAGMGDVVTALLLALVAENAELREQLASAQDMLVETAIDAGNMYALIEAMRTERDVWQEEAERLQRRDARRA
jgi:pyridoxal/pyridoxine/pyridoxamine kinase